MKALSARHRPIAIDNLGIILIFIALLCGKFSLMRISMWFESLGWLSNVAYWFILPIGFIALINLCMLNSHPQAWNLKIYLLSTILLHIYMVLSSMWVPFADLESALQLLLVALFIFFAYVFLRYRPERKLGLILALTFWTGLIYALGGIMSSGFGSGRMAAFGGGPNVFIRVVGSGLIAGLYLYFVRGRRLVLVAFPILLLSALASGSRGGMIGLLLSFSFLCVLVLPRYFKWRKFFTAGILLGLLIWLGFSLIDTRGVEALIKKRYYTLLIETQYMSERDMRFSEAWRILLENPMMGIGLGGYSSASGFSNYPHNLILHIGAEGGILGLLPLFLSLILLVQRWFQPRSVENDFSMALCMFYFLSSLVSGNIYDARFIWFYGLLYMLPKPEKSLTTWRMVPAKGVLVLPSLRF